MKIVFIAGPYIGDGSYDAIERNIDRAEELAIRLANRGIAFFCPHLNTAHFEAKADAGEEFYREMDREILARCDAILMLASWTDSTGACLEHGLASQLGKPIFYWYELDKLVAWYQS